jgi:phosphoribosylamine--glycine ligase
MKILIIGSGGREHALAWKIAQSPLAEKIYCAPGNGGTASLTENVPLKAEDIAGLLKFAREKEIDLTVVGPEVPLSLGIVDEFQRAGLRIFGPNRAGAMIESSKAWAKEFMIKYGIPTAASGIFTDRQGALAYLAEVGAPIVVKADGLAAGKGVVVCQTKKEAAAAIDLIMKEKEFGEAGSRVVIEECLVGEEASIIALTDGETIVPLVSSQDHKRVFDNDQGPNTGGMGAYSPAPLVTERLMEEIKQTVLLPFVAGMKQEGIDFRGVVYAGIMVTKKGPKVLEFNARFGDPETQPIMMRLKSDLIPIIEAVIDRRLAKTPIVWEERAAVCVVLAAGGYPGKYEKGREIKGLDNVPQIKDAYVFHAGTELKEGKVLTSGGRVLGVTALGDSIKFAIQKAYQAVGLVSFAGMHYRKDIGKKALKYER